MNVKFYQAAIVGTTCVAVGVLTGCTGSMTPLNSVINTQSSPSNSSSIVSKTSLTVTNSDGSLVYSDASVVPSSSLTMLAGQSYVIQLSQASSVAGTTFSLVATQTNVVNGATVSTPLQLGSNNFTAPLQGDYSWKVVATPPNASPISSFYIANVTCSSPTFTASSLDASKIVVSAGTSANLFNLSASGVTTGANGMAPYTCAWDPTGTGIQDTAFQSCDSAISNFYSNFLGVRQVGLIVKDSCNATYPISNPATFTSAEPSMPGNVFITGQISSAGGKAVGDPRIDGVSYLATNVGGHNIVQPNYNSGAFQIYSLLNYGEPSSVLFGLQIKLSGIKDTINVSSGSGTIDASAAKIASVTFSTDQIGDQSPAVSMSGSNCTLSNQGAKVLFTAGQPCSSGTSGDNNMATVEVWGHYSCTDISGDNDSANIQGDFDGYTNLVDNCGGGGGGGGGIVPINL
jgi:hypothetical protein